MLDHLHRYDSNELLAKDLAAAIVSNLQAAIDERGGATMAVSGGNTPRVLFRQLSGSSINWPAVSITQVDERWVPEDHADSNAKLIRETLLQDRATDARFISMKTEHDDAFSAEAAASERLAKFSDGIDVVILGMGDDGHTASFFPGAETLSRAMDLNSPATCVAVHPPKAAHDRMTLTRAALLRTRHLYLHIIGANKWAVLQQAADGADPATLPIRGLLDQESPALEIYYASEDK